MSVPPEKAILIRLDMGFIAAIEAERDAMPGGKKFPRTAMIRTLLKEALDARRLSRQSKH